MSANWGFYNSPNAWPYTNFHELNLDWMLEKLKEQETATTTIQQALDTTNERIDQTNTNVSTLSTQNLATLQVAFEGRAVYNLMDNSYFLNPVNQRGITTITSNDKYFMDRWVTNSVSDSQPVTISASGLTMNNSSGITTQSVRQYIANIKDGRYTAAAKAKSSVGESIYLLQFTLTGGAYKQVSTTDDKKGKIYITGTGESLAVHLQAVAGESVTYEWSALYEGFYTADDLPDYVPKGYAVELAECQRYYRRTKTGMFVGVAANAAQFSTVNFSPMRIAPTVTTTAINGNNVEIVGSYNDGFRVYNPNANNAQITWEASADL